MGINWRAFRGQHRERSDVENTAHEELALISLVKERKGGNSCCKCKNQLYRDRG